MVFAPVLSVASFPSAAADAQTPALTTYTNARYGYSISYPRDLLVAEQESENGDGRRFHARRGSGFLLVWADNNALDQTPSSIAAEAAQDCRGRPLAYKVVKPNLVALSCLTPRGRVFYQKTLIRGDLLTSIQMNYPVADKAQWDAATAQIAQSLCAVAR